MKKVIWLISVCMILCIPLSLQTSIAQSITDTGIGTMYAGNSVHKVVHFIKKMDGQTIWLENGQQYSLSGVKVMDFTKTSSKGGQLAPTKKVAELTFLNDRLIEVIIR